MTLSRPQRIALSAPIGSLLKGTSGTPAARKTEGCQDRDYLMLVRQCPCLSCGMEPSEAAHVRFASAAHGVSSGMAKKPPDRLALPLCAGCHRLDRNAQHQGDERLFWLRLGIDPHLLCERLYAQRGDLVAMRAVVMVAISERKTQQ
jgi:hypothetical protein